MIVIIAAAVIGITVVCLLNRKSQWNRVGGIFAVILGCALAILLYYNMKASPDVETIFLTIGLTSFLLVLVSILVSLLFRKEEAYDEKPDVPNLEERKKTPKEFISPVIHEVRKPIELPAETVRKAEEPSLAPTVTAEIEHTGNDEKEEPPPYCFVKAQEVQKAQDEATEDGPAGGQPEAVEGDTQLPDEKQDEMDQLKALVLGGKYVAALRQVFHILDAGYAVSPGEKERLKAILKMLKEKTESDRGKIR